MKNTKVLIVITLFAANSAWAMQPLEDMELAQSTGQDGLTVSIGTVGGSGTYSFDSISLEDTDGSVGSSTHTAAAALNYKVNGINKGISFYSGTSKNIGIATPLAIIIDADGNGTKPTMNAMVALDPNLTRLALDPFTISMSKLNAAKEIITNNERELIRAKDGLKIDFKANNQVKLNIQLGNQPQGALFSFVGGAIDRVDLTNLELVSYECSALCTTATPTITEGGKIKLDLSLSTNTTDSPDGFRLSGFMIDPTTEGLIINRAGTTDKFDLTISNLTMGEKGNQATGTFNNLKNGSIGNIGMNGMSITDFKMTVSGM